MSPAGSFFVLNGKRYEHDELKRAGFPLSGSAFETETLKFCHEWLRGDSEFTMTTSGSTGTPAVITVSRASMEASARATAAAIGLLAGDTALVCLSTQYIAGKMMLVRSFALGMNIVAVEPLANPFSVLSPDVKIDFTALVPYQLNSVLASADGLSRLNQLKTIIVGGSETDAKTRGAIADINAGVYATYGMTETISHIALQKLNSPAQQDHFFALPGVELSIDDRGCLVIEARYLGVGRIITNDLVELFSPAEFRWLGRWDNVINTGSVKVIPEKVEKAVAAFFLQHDLTCRFFVAGLPDETLGHVVVLVIEGTLSDGKELSLSQFLASSLTRYEVPKRFFYLDRFTETGTGKINRRETIRELH